MRELEENPEEIAQNLLWRNREITNTPAVEELAHRKWSRKA